MSYELGGEEATPFFTVGADYVIRKSGSVYLAEGRAGNQDLHEASLGTLWDDIYGEVSEPVIVFTRGTFTVDAALDIQDSRTKVYGQGPGATILIAGTDLNDHIFTWNGGNYYYDVEIKHMRIDGNKDNQSGAGPYRGINAYITAACTLGADTSWGVLEVDHVHVRETKGTGIYFYTNTGDNIIAGFQRIRIAECGDGSTETYDMMVRRMFDGYISDSLVGSLDLSKITTNCFSNIYIGGDGQAKPGWIHGGDATYPCRGNIFDSVRFDNPNTGASADGGCLSLEDYAYFNLFHGCAFTNLNINSTTNLAPALQVDDNSIGNAFLSCWWGYTRYYAITDQFKYAIEEKGSAADNIYHGYIQDRDVQGNALWGTGEISLRVGGGSEWLGRMPKAAILENWGTATILNGNTSIITAHGMTETPTNIKVTGTTLDTASLYVDTVGAANFTIHATGAVGGNRTVYWHAWWDREA